MVSPSRRAFLAQTAAAGLAAVGASGLMAADAGQTQMTIAKWAGAAKPTDDEIKGIAAKLVKQAVDALGGMSRFVKKGDVVWIKPNIGWDRAPELAANTNPEVLAEIVKMCFDAGAKKVKVGDNPVHPAQKAYESSGIAAALKPLGAEVLFVDRDRFKDTAIKGERIQTVPLYPEILECDLMINVPIVKHHVLATATLCMKNYMGVMEARRTFHQDIPACLTDLTRFLKPRLCILDAVRILKAHGPSGGKLEDVEAKLAVAAGTDIVALDAWGAELLGHKPADIGSIAAGQKGGLGTMDYRKLALKELAVS